MSGFGAIMRLLCGNCIMLREVPDYALYADLILANFWWKCMETT